MRDGAVVARRAHNPKVISSSLVPATKIETLHFGVRFFLFLFLEEIFKTVSNETICLN
jgi:hypothetical protein